MSVPNPFNPRIPSHPDGFIGRENELSEFSNCLNSTIHSSTMSMAIVGNRGIGKSSFLAKCDDLAKNRNCIVIRFSSIEGGFESIEDLCSYILVQIQNEVTKRSKLALLKKNSIDFFKTFDFKISYKEFGIEVKSKASQSILQSLFREKLSEIWKNASNSCSGIVIMIDEAEVIEQIPGMLMFLREVFSRLGEEKSSYMLVLSGKLAFPQQMSEKFSPLARFFHPLELHNFTKQESILLIETKLKATKVKIDEKTTAKMHDESEGHPYVLTAIAYILYENLPEGDHELRLKHYAAIKPKISNYLNADYFGIMYRKLSPTTKLLLRYIARQGGRATFAEICKAVKKPKGTVSPLVIQLVEQGSLIKIERGTYKIFHNLYKGYLLTVE
ncbi:MAG: AAA family ATPase [Candidatus Micrarchaeota archaeon]